MLHPLPLVEVAVRLLQLHEHLQLLLRNASAVVTNLLSSIQKKILQTMTQGFTRLANWTRESPLHIELKV